MSLESINPASGDRIAAYDAMRPDEVRAIVRSASAAQPGWAAIGFGARAAILHRAAQILRGRADEWARLMALEMGKPVTQGKAEAEKSAWGCDYYADNAEQFL